MLAGKPKGTFLIRLSSNIGCYALSYVSSNGEVSKGLITRNRGDNQMKVEGDEVKLESFFC